MAFSFRRLSKRFIAATNVLVCMILLFSLLLPRLNPDQFWFAGFLAIALPYTAVVSAAFLLFWLIFYWPNAAISAIALAISYPAIDNIINWKADVFSVTKPEGSMRVMSWNVRSFAGIASSTTTAADELERLIQQYQPDIVAFQEFGVYDKPENNQPNRIKALNLLGYPHYVLSKDYNRKRYGYSNGLAIFSKYPFASTKRIPYTSSAESVLGAAIVFGKDTFNLFTSHLQSYQFSEANYKEIDKIQAGEDSLVKASKNIIVKMKRAFRNRGSQARQLQAALDSSRYPSLVLCDLNDVPNSYAYGKMTETHVDAFVKKGYGLGRTFVYLLPTLRIDYVFASPDFSVLQYHQINNQLSDHLAIVADVIPINPPKAIAFNGDSLTK